VGNVNKVANRVNALFRYAKGIELEVSLWQTSNTRHVRYAVAPESERTALSVKLAMAPEQFQNTTRQTKRKNRSQQHKLGADTAIPLPNLPG
jgi:hypothetical protein